MFDGITLSGRFLRSKFDQEQMIDYQMSLPSGILLKKRWKFIGLRAVMSRVLFVSDFCPPKALRVSLKLCSFVTWICAHCLIHRLCTGVFLPGTQQNQVDACELAFVAFMI